MCESTTLVPAGSLPKGAWFQCGGVTFLKLYEDECYDTQSKSNTVCPTDKMVQPVDVEVRVVGNRTINRTDADNVNFLVSAWLDGKEVWYYAGGEWMITELYHDLSVGYASPDGSILGGLDSLDCVELFTRKVKQ